jgi:hypothetical protein
MPNDPNPPPEQPADARGGRASPQQIGKAVHDLRNGMNSLMMNAAVLGASIKDVPESLRPFVAQIASAGRKCSEELTTLLALVDTYRD